MTKDPQTDTKLLREFAVAQDGAIFAEVVRRHIDFVYATALRQVNGDAHLASDITQLVFVDLAKKCSQVAQHPVLAGWLHTSTRYAAAQFIRSEERRRRREERAHAMIENDRPDAPTDQAGELQPLLDEVLGHLKPHERDALLLRFFERKTYLEVGQQLQLSETAARSCIDRALDKMQGLLARRGITSTAAALAASLSSLPTIAAPSGLASTVTGAAVAGVGVTGIAGIVLFMSKLPTAIAAALIVTGIGAVSIELNANTKLHAQVDALANASPDKSSQLTASTANTATLAQTINGAATPLPPSDERSESAELVLLRNRYALLTKRPDGVVDSEIRSAQNVGRATPEAAAQSLMYAVQNHDVQTAATFFQFVDDSPENREKFMANFSEAIRRRYPTPEQICAAGNFGIGPEAHFSPDDGMQVLHVSSGPGEGKALVYAWYRHNGNEYGSEGGYVPDKNGGWAMPVGLTNLGWIQYVSSRLDPKTGDYTWHPAE